MFSDSKHSLTDKKLSWTVGNYSTIPLLPVLPISMHALTGKKLHGLCGKLLHHITPIPPISLSIPILYIICLCLTIRLTTAYKILHARS